MNAKLSALVLVLLSLVVGLPASAAAPPSAACPAPPGSTAEAALLAANPPSLAALLEAVPPPQSLSCSATSLFACPTPGGGSSAPVSCVGVSSCSPNDYYVVCDGTYTFCGCWFNGGNPGCVCDCYREGGLAKQCLRECGG